MSFDQQQGYIQLQGEAVSIAARAAFLEVEASDKAYNEALEKQIAELDATKEYLESPLARKLWQSTLERHTSTQVHRYTKRGIFWDTIREREVTKVDHVAVWKELRTADPRWEFAETNFYRSADEYQFCEWSALRYYNCRQSNAHYYEQFFDLKGTVYLTLDQYARLKTYMEGL